MGSTDDRRLYDEVGGGMGGLAALASGFAFFGRPLFLFGLTSVMISSSSSSENTIDVAES